MTPLSSKTSYRGALYNLPEPPLAPPGPPSVISRNTSPARTHLMLKQRSLCWLQARVCSFEL